MCAILTVVTVSGLFVLIGALLPFWKGGRYPVIGYSLPWELPAVLVDFAAEG
jgi:hypothetical protein